MKLFRESSFLNKLLFCLVQEVLVRIRFERKSHKVFPNAIIEVSSNEIAISSKRRTAIFEKFSFLFYSFSAILDKINYKKCLKFKKVPITNGFEYKLGVVNASCWIVKLKEVSGKHINISKKLFQFKLRKFY